MADIVRKLMNLKWQLAQAAEIRWWQWYLNDKRPEVYLEDKRAYWQRVLEKIEVILPKSEQVLDAGCGPAGIFTVLEDRQVDAVDPLLLHYEKKLDHFSRKDYPWVQFIAEPLERFEPEKQYDLVFCMNAINHVADLDQSIDRLLDALSPSGILVLSVDVHRHRHLKKLFRLLPGDILHPHQHDLAEYLALFEKRGRRILQTSGLKTGLVFNYYLIVIGNPVEAQSNG